MRKHSCQVKSDKNLNFYRLFVFITYTKEDAIQIRIFKVGYLQHLQPNNRGFKKQLSVSVPAKKRSNPAQGEPQTCTDQLKRQFLPRIFY